MTLSRRILLQVGLGTTLVIAAITAAIYHLVYQTLDEHGRGTLDAYMSERVEVESTRYRQIEANLKLARGLFLQRLENVGLNSALGPIDSETEKSRLLARGFQSVGLFQRWNARHELFPDGAWRTRRAFTDPKKHAFMWSHRDAAWTPRQQYLVLAAERLTEELLAGWSESFPSVQFYFPGPICVGVNAMEPPRVWDIPADYSAESSERLRLALPAQPPPPDQFFWSAVQQEKTAEPGKTPPGPRVTVLLPIYEDGEFIGSVGHDIAMGPIMDKANDDFAGLSYAIFAKDGRVIAHPTLKNRILESGGTLTAEASGDPALRAAYQAMMQDGFWGRAEGAVPESDIYFNVGPVQGPPWFFATLVKHSAIQRQARDAAQWVLWSGLASLALVLTALAIALRRNVSLPLASLAEATKAMAAGDTTARAVSTGATELSALANSFNDMAARVAQRDTTLREVNVSLEQRVSERTADLLKIQEDLRSALRAEQELSDLRANFVSLVSHEFRTPLGVIMSAADVLRLFFESLTPEKRLHHLETITRSTRTLANLIEEVLFIRRIEEGRMHFEPVPVDLRALCGTFADEVLSAFNRKCEIDFIGNGALENARSDETLLRHILCNLLSNAVKYSDSGQRVAFSISREGEHGVFRIEDRGIGILPEDRPHLFHSFVRGRNVGTRQGTGLGLIIVKRCVDLHGGTLDLTSTPGSGTTVTIRLPLFAGASTATTATK